jgi:hypothetical protein
MNFMPAVLASLRVTLADVLAGRATLAEARRRAAAVAGGATRVLRRADVPLSAAEDAMVGAWPRKWPVTVRDVCRVEPSAYVTTVRAWATAVVATLG